MVQEPRLVRRLIFLAAIVLGLLVVTVFVSVLGFEFVDLDVHGHVVENPHIQGLTGENIKYILSERCVTSYYPIRTLTFAIDYQIWGLDPKGFKLTNVLVHLTNVILVFWLVLRLFRDRRLSDGSSPAWDVSVATVSAGIFAVHPVVVEPVAWVAGREELLMTLGALGCLHFHFTARRLEEAGHRNRAALVCHAGAAVACAAACLSNAVAAVIPLLITTWDVLMLRRPKFGRIVRGTSALWVIGLATFVIKKLGDIPNMANVPQIYSGGWLLFVLNTFWLNLKTLVWPTELGIQYIWPNPRSFFELEVLLGVMALGLVCLVLWTLRRRKRILFGLLWFGLALVPSSHLFFTHHIARADRFLYLPLVGLALALGAGLRPLKNVLKENALWAIAGAGVLVVLLLATMSVGQTQTWRNSISLWENALGLDYRNAFANSCLARNLAVNKQFDKSLLHYERAMQLQPVAADTLADFAWLLATCDDRRLRDFDRAVRLAESARQATNGSDQKILNKLAIVRCSFAQDLADRGEFGPAIANYNKSMAADPQHDVPLFNLALLLTTCPNAELRQPDRAVILAERGCEVTEEIDALRMSILAAAYAEARRFDEAVVAVKKAISLSKAANDLEMTAELRGLLALYQNGTPFNPLRASRPVSEADAASNPE